MGELSGIGKLLKQLDSLVAFITVHHFGTAVSFRPFHSPQVLAIGSLLIPHKILLRISCVFTLGQMS